MPITISGSGTITGLTTGGLPDGSIAAGDLSSTLDLTGKTVTLPSGTGGKILQVVQTFFTDVFSVTTPADTFVDITGFTLNITPSSSSNKVLVMVQVGRAGASPTAGRQIPFRLMRDSTAIAVGPSAGLRMLASFSVSSTDNAYNNSGGMNYLDSPNTTSQITYKLQMSTQVVSEAAVINAAGNPNTDSVDTPWSRAVSTLIAMEVAA